MPAKTFQALNNLIPILVKITKITAIILLVFVVTLWGLAYYITTDSGQAWAKNMLVNELSDKLQTKVKVDSIVMHVEGGSMHFYGFEMCDHDSMPMLIVDTLEASVGIHQLINRRIVLNGLKLTGTHALLYKTRPDTLANYQFLFDAFKKEKNTDGGKPKHGKALALDIDLRHAEFKNMNLSWNIHSERIKGGDTLDVNHFNVFGMSAKLKGKFLAEKTAEITITDLHARERKSGLHFDLTKAEYSTHKQQNTNAVLAGLKANYQDKKVSFDRIVLHQDKGDFSLKDKMEMRIDSLRYSCNNGKPRKNVGKPKRGAFDPGHLDAVINCKLILQRFEDNELQASIDSLWATDIGSGLHIENMKTMLTATDRDVELTDLHISMANSHFDIKQLQADYTFTPGNKLKGIKSKLELNIHPSPLTADVLLFDIEKPFAPVLQKFTTPLKLNVTVGGSLDRLTFSNILVSTPDNRLRITANGDLCNAADKEQFCMHFTDVHLDARQGIKEQIIGHFIPRSRQKMVHQMKAIGNIQFAGRFTVWNKIQNFNGTLITDFGNVNAKFDINANTHYMTGTCETRELNLGPIMNVKQLGAVSAKAEYSFDIASKRIAKQIGRPHGKLPNGKLKADISKARFNGIKFNNIHADIDSKSTNAEGLIYIPNKVFDIIVGFTYTQTEDKQKLSIKPSVKKHRKEGITLAAYKQELQEKQKAKARKKAERAARRAERAARRAENKVDN